MANDIAPQDEERRGMVVRKPRGFSGDTPSHYYTQLIDVCVVVEDKDYGKGIAGFSQLTGRPVIVFSNPVLSKRRQEARNAKTMTQWVNGLRIGANTFSFGPGSKVLVQDVVTRDSLPPRKIVMEGKEWMADVFLCQWISSWLAKEQINAPAEEKKNIFWGYGIAQSIPATDTHEELALFRVFLPVGPDNRFNRGNTQYPVVFSFNKLEDLLAFVDREQERLKGTFTSYMTRVIDKQSGRIVGSGEIISCYDYRTPDDKTSEVFLRNLARRLSLTYTGLEKLVGDPKYTFEVYGLMDLTPTRYLDMQGGNNNKPTLNQRVLRNANFIPRGEDGEQSELQAVPTAFRGRNDPKYDTFWLDRADIIGYVGRDAETKELSPESDIIPADSYSCTPQDESTGYIMERGLRRIYPVFKKQDGTDFKVQSMRDLARAIGCESVTFPDGRWSREVFDASWDTRAKKPEPAPAKNPEPAPAQATQAGGQRRVQQQDIPAPENARRAMQPASAPDPYEAGMPDEGYPGADEVPF